MNHKLFLVMGLHLSVFWVLFATWDAIVLIRPPSVRAHAWQNLLRTDWGSMWESIVIHITRLKAMIEIVHNKNNIDSNGLDSIRHLMLSGSLEMRIQPKFMVQFAQNFLTRSIEIVGLHIHVHA